MRPFCPWARPVIRIDSIWLATEPLDMRSGTETALARVVGHTEGRRYDVTQPWDLNGHSQGRGQSSLPSTYALLLLCSA